MKKKQIKYTMARALLSDTLPYEIPLTFSNRHFYQFVNEFNIQFINDKSNSQSIICNLSDNKFEIILKLLFGTNKPLMGKKINIDEKMHRRVPFVFNIAHKANRFRELTIPHPKSQLELVAFYDVYKELILYYSNISLFSIRKPDKIAKFAYQNDNLHKMNLGDEDDAIESSDREYENLKTFFTYSQYPHIYKFYEDYRYHRAEKKYDKLFKFDISKCFDSIYTHSIGWAINSKEYAKEYCSSNGVAEFGNRFDKFMQNTNYGETNGIVIGPEFSRIFAEIILQKIDKTVEQRLKTRKENNLTFKRDYEVFRYVDDYFVFYNDDKVKEDVLTEYELMLKMYKMSISESKSIHYVKPLITELTIAKDKITNLIDTEIFLKIEKKDGKERISDFQINCNSKALITKFKTIIKESNVEYKDVMNFTLHLINKKVKQSISRYETYVDGLEKIRYESSFVADINSFTVEEWQKKVKQESLFNKYMWDLLDFVFFIYSVNPRVSFTVKLCHILSKILLTYKQRIQFKGSSEKIKRFTDQSKEFVFKKISDEIVFTLERRRLDKYIQVESLYLLIALAELGEQFRLTEEQLKQYFNLKLDEDRLVFQADINYFVITVLLFYIKNEKSYLPIKKAIKLQIICLFEKEERIEKRSSKSENVLLLFDIIVCPYLDAKFKREVLSLFGVTSANEQNIILNFKNVRKYWFTKWNNFNFAKELEAKIANELAY